MSTDRDFLRQVHVMALIDKIFTYATPIFCALVIIGALAVILTRGGIR